MKPSVWLSRPGPIRSSYLWLGLASGLFWSHTAPCPSSQRFRRRRLRAVSCDSGARSLCQLFKDLPAANLFVSRCVKACVGRFRRRRGRRIRSPASRAGKGRGGNRKLSSWSTLSWSVRREDGSPLRRATHSGVVLDCEHGVDARHALAMLYTICDHAEGERLGLGDSVL